MPFTPPALRPIGRTSVSRKRMAWPSWLARKIIFLPSVSLAPISSSLPSRVMAMMPVERGLFYRAVARGHENELAGLFEIAGGYERGEFFIFLEFHEARDRFAARSCGGFREFINLEPIDAALGGEQQDITVRRGDEEMLDEVFFFGARADAAFAAA